jgi:hypothetical protein
LACAALVLPCLAQNTPELARILSFEAEHTGGFPAGWDGSPRDSIALDDKVVHGGKWSVRIERQEGHWISWAGRWYGAGICGPKALPVSPHLKARGA